MKAADAITVLGERLVQLLNDAPHLTLSAMPDAGLAMTVGALTHMRRRPVVWVFQDHDDVASPMSDLQTLIPSLKPWILPFPPYYDDMPDDMDVMGQRFKTLSRMGTLTSDGTPVIITCRHALLQPIPDPNEWSSLLVPLKQHKKLAPEALVSNLAALDYVFEAEVLTKGQASRRGGILDVWPPAEAWPLRIEWFDDVIESLRYFDPESQRTIEVIEHAIITPAKEHPATSSSTSGHLLDYLHASCTLVYNHSPMQSTATQATKPTAMDNLIPGEPGLADLQCAYPDVELIEIGDEDQGLQTSHSLMITPLSHAVTLPASSGTQQLEQARQRLFADLDARMQRQHNIVLYFESAGSLDHFRHHIGKNDPRTAHWTLLTGALSQGFCMETLGLTIVAESDLYGRRRLSRRFERIHERQGRGKRYAGSRIQDYTDIEEGDLVVHADHGVGRYQGIREIVFQGQSQEVLTIAYADDALLYVPVTHAHLLSRYIGMSGRQATLHRLGGKRWAKEKRAAGAAVVDLAAELLEIQAKRNLLQGHAFSSDTPLQHEFENAFPFEETEDQEIVMEEIRADMQSSRPMDRLICGDAGYGKTEVAMRAAFKATQDHYQVAMLVPTTVLAQQHYQTFMERMAGFPVRIAMISRFQPPAARRRILDSLEQGDIDIIIGTHALVQPGVRFSNLGLVIIDEEQRFGVAHKERLKSVKQLVDVLTLSATPIPRTLYMSMTGARDMSLLRTPPRERVPIETIMTRDSDEVIRQAIRRELTRGGQVYFLHNRVASINRLLDRLSNLVPEARIEIAHGQMRSIELSGVMQRFAAGETDVLLCTTLIESGMDIPHANTILIDRADRFGISDLYQLRGRVGRSDRKAYAFFLLPDHLTIEREARERIQAIRQHSGLGAGFNLAIRDMEIRGAGNLLGAAQSGHIAAVGFSLYCRLLEQAVNRMKGHAPPREVTVEMRLDFLRTAPRDVSDSGALLSHDYIADERLRVMAYRHLAEADSQEELDDLSQAWRDRFGPLPATALRLIEVTRLRLEASLRDIDLIEVRQRKIMLRRNGDYLTRQGQFPLMPKLSVDQALAYLQKHLREHVP